MERRPDRGPDHRGHRKPPSDSRVAGWSRRTDLKGEPVLEIDSCSFPQVGLRDRQVTLPADVDVHSCSDANLARQEGGSSLDDPAPVAPVEAREKTVICKVALQLRQRPVARLRHGPQAIGQGASHGRRRLIRVRHVTLG